MKAAVDIKKKNHSILELELVTRTAPLQLELETRTKSYGEGVFGLHE